MGMADKVSIFGGFLSKEVIYLFLSLFFIPILPSFYPPAPHTLKALQTGRAPHTAALLSLTSAMGFSA